MYHSWRKAFPPDIDICPVEYPGRGTRMRDPLCTSLPGLLDDLLPFVLQRQRIPFAFFGHSLGALVAYELARWLRRNGHNQPVGLLVSGFAAPHLPRRSPPIHHLPEPFFINRLREYNGTPEEVLQNQEIMEVMFPILRADFTIAETYRHFPGQPLTCPITVLGGLQDKDATLQELYAWKKHTEGSCHTHVFPGGHFYLHAQQQPLQKRMVIQLRKWLLHQSGGERNHSG